MLEKIKEYLQSDDREIVELGASLLESQVDIREWVNILEECLKHKPITQNNNLCVTYTWDLPYKKWRYEIIQNKIIIKDAFFPEGLWSQLSTGTTNKYKVHTGKAGLAMISKAMTDLYNKPNIRKKSRRNKNKNK